MDKLVITCQCISVIYEADIVENKIENKKKSFFIKKKLKKLYFSGCLSVSTEKLLNRLKSNLISLIICTTYFLLL